ncbi:MAG: hypothetical protein JXA96_14740 [Sedimentisphaerales bacterium]|nr:hypothetical protein [Sedimentisphaerales bacterium]
MALQSKYKNIYFLIIVGLLGWLVPGAGHFAINKKNHAFIIFFAIAITFVIGLYIGSVAVIDPTGSKPWFAAQIMNSPAIFILGHISETGGYYSYGKSAEIGQIYTSIAGLLNLLCIVNSVYWAHLLKTENVGE